MASFLRHIARNYPKTGLILLGFLCLLGIGHMSMGQAPPLSSAQLTEAFFSEDDCFLQDGQGDQLSDEATHSQRRSQQVNRTIALPPTPQQYPKVLLWLADEEARQVFKTYTLPKQVCYGFLFLLYLF